MNGGCPTPANTSVRPAYIVPNNAAVSDPWAFYKRVFTFQVSTPAVPTLSEINGLQPAATILNFVYEVIWFSIDLESPATLRFLYSCFPFLYPPINCTACAYLIRILLLRACNWTKTVGISCPAPCCRLVASYNLMQCSAMLHDFEVLIVLMQGDGNSTGTGNPGGYCYAEQPAWSAYREPSFGHGTLDIVNSTTALWYTSHMHACLLQLHVYC